MMFKRITLVAHRGYSAEAPENTHAAFTEALMRGYDHIEFDVQLTKDGVPVVIHDLTVDRTTNASGLVKDYTFSEIQELDAGSWFDESFKGQTVPSLSEVLALLKGRARLHIELKSDEPELPTKVASLLRATGWVGLTKRQSIGVKLRGPTVIISSSNRSLIIRSMELLPLPVVHELIVERADDESLEWAAAHNLYSYHPAANDVTPELVKKGKRLGLHIGAWWWDISEQDVRMIKGARYAFVDAPDNHRSPVELLIMRNKIRR